MGLRPGSPGSAVHTRMFFGAGKPTGSARQPPTPLSPLPQRGPPVLDSNHDALPLLLLVPSPGRFTLPQGAFIGVCRYADVQGAPRQRGRPAACRGTPPPVKLRRSSGGRSGLILSAHGAPQPSLPINALRHRKLHPHRNLRATSAFLSSGALTCTRHDRHVNINQINQSVNQDVGPRSAFLLPGALTCAVASR